jgi:hypothetical protein
MTTWRTLLGVLFTLSLGVGCRTDRERKIERHDVDEQRPGASPTSPTTTTTDDDRVREIEPVGGSGTSGGDIDRGGSPATGGGSAREGWGAGRDGGADLGMPPRTGTGTTPGTHEPGTAPGTGTSPGGAGTSPSGSDTDINSGSGGATGQPPR